MRTYFITLIMYLIGKVITGARLDWFDHLYNSVSNLKAYQLVIYKNQTANKHVTKMHLKLEQLFESIPSRVIDLSQLDINDNDTHIISTRKVAYSTGVVIFLHLGNNKSEIINFINYYENQYPKQPRQKCLVIYFTEKISFKNSLKKILQYAWQKKFLDFTIVEVHTNSSEIFLNSFNPFFNKTKIIKLFNNVELFPNKLRDLNKYPFILPIYSDRPYLIVSTDSTEKIKLRSFRFDSFLLTVLKEMNFFVNYEEINFKNEYKLKILSDVFEKLENHDLNMGIVSMSSTKIPESLPILFLHTDCIRYFGVMKRQLATSFDLSSNTLILFTAILALIFFVKRVIILLKLNAYDFDMLDVLRIAIGMSLTSLPKTWPKKLFIVLALLASVFTSAEFFTFLTEVFHVREEISFHSADEIYESEFKLITSSSTFHTITQFMDNSSKVLFDEHVYVNDSINRLYYALENDKTICIIGEIRLNVELKRSKLLSKIMKILPLNFFCAKEVYPFEAASPYLNYFGKFFQKMYQSGIFNWLNKKYFMQKSSQISKTLENEELHEQLRMTLMLMCTVGMAASSVVFILELFYFNNLPRRLFLRNF